MAALYAFFAPIAFGLLSAIPGSGRQGHPSCCARFPRHSCWRPWERCSRWIPGQRSAACSPSGSYWRSWPWPARARRERAPAFSSSTSSPAFPYAPESLGARLLGLTAGTLLLAACEVLLPDPSAVSYRERLARALGTAAGGPRRARSCPEAARGRIETAAVAHPAGGKTGRSGPDGSRAAPGRPLGTPASGPAGDTRRSDTGAADEASAALLGQVAAVCTACARFLRTGSAPPMAGALEEAMRRFQEERVRLVSGPPGAMPRPPCCNANRGCWHWPNRPGSWRSPQTSP
ncbi:hypothetical protein NKH18_16115 [Streptomyces sp. M10(2022)]